MQLTAYAANALGNLEIFDVGGFCCLAPIEVELGEPLRRILQVMGVSVMRQLVQIRILLALSLALALGCASASGPPEVRHAEHLGFVFPRQVGRLTLQNFQEYDDALFGAVANYRLSPEDPLIVSAYIFPAPRYPDESIQPIETHASEELQGLLQHYEGAVLVDWPEELRYKNFADRAFHQAALEIEHPDIGQAFSLIALSEEGDARIKIRISFLPEDADAGFAIRSFFESFP